MLRDYERAKNEMYESINRSQIENDEFNRLENKKSSFSKGRGTWLKATASERSKSYDTNKLVGTTFND